MIITIFSSCLLGSSLFMLLLAIHLFYRIRFELSSFEMQLLARDIDLKASIKEQIKGGIDFHMRALPWKTKKPTVKKAVK